MNITNNSKKIIYIVIAILIVLGVVYALTQYNRSKHGADYNRTEINALPEDERKQELENKIRDLEKEAESNPVYTVYVQLAEANLDLGRYQPALDTLNKIAEEDRNNRVLADFARAYHGLGNSQLAIDYINRAIAIDDGIAENWRIYFEIAQNLPVEELNAKYQQALQLTKNDLEIVKSYARFLEKQGDIAKAVAYWETARNKDPENAQEYDREISRLRPSQQ